MSPSEKSRGGRPVGSGAPKTNAVKEVRKSLKITQEALAREIGCTLGAVRTAEREGRLFQKSEVMTKFEKLAIQARVSLP